MADMSKKAGGDDQSQRDQDAKGFKISSEMVTGGTTKDLNEGGTQEVGYGPDHK